MEVKGLRDLISDDPKSVTNLPPLPEWRGILLLLYLKILHLVLDDTDCTRVPPANKATCIARKE